MSKRACQYLKIWDSVAKFQLLIRTFKKNKQELNKYLARILSLKVEFPKSTFFKRRVFSVCHSYISELAEWIIAAALG